MISIIDANLGEVNQDESGNLNIGSLLGNITSQIRRTGNPTSNQTNQTNNTSNNFTAQNANTNQN